MKRSMWTDDKKIKFVRDNADLCYDVFNEHNSEDAKKLYKKIRAEFSYSKNSSNSDIYCAFRNAYSYFHGNNAKRDLANKICKALWDRKGLYMNEDKTIFATSEDKAQCVKIVRKLL